MNEHLRLRRTVQSTDEDVEPDTWSIVHVQADGSEEVVGSHAGRVRAAMQAHDYRPDLEIVAELDGVL